MANGPYGAALSAAGAMVKVTTSAPPANKVRTISIGAVNTTDTPARIYIAVSAAANAAGVQLVDHKAYGRTLNARDEYERTNQTIGVGQNVYVMSDIDGVVFDVHGFEGDA